MNKHIPYTYLIGWTEEDKYYYGVRYARNCNPNDLWKTYFTSSNYVKEFRKEKGEPDLVQIRKVFNCPKKALNWESKFLKKINASKNEKFLNKSNPSKICFETKYKNSFLEVPKDDLASMEHPIFSLATKPDMRHLHYQNGDNTLEILPSTHGLPTIKDKDILIFCISQLMARKNQGKEISDTVRLSARELSIATNRPIGGNHYKRLEDAFARLQGTQFVTNIKTGNEIETRIFSLIDEGGFVRTADDKFRLNYCEVKLSRWMMRAVETGQVVTISPDYFFLRRPLERRLYEIARKHCGNSPKWQISLEKLQLKTGSNATLKRFRSNIREIIEADVTPFYEFELCKNDNVIVRPRHIIN